MTSKSILLKLRGFDMKLYYIELDGNDTLVDAENILKSSYPMDFKDTESIQFSANDIKYKKQIPIKDLEYKDYIMISCKIPIADDIDKEESTNYSTDETVSPTKGKAKKSKTKKTD